MPNENRRTQEQTTVIDGRRDAASSCGGDLVAGQFFGSYVLEAQIGRGGMGDVYRARQTVPVERTVALKLLQQRLKGTLAEALFEVESQALARLRHPSIAQVFDAGSLDGQPYLAMEWVEGLSIREWLAAQRPDLRTRLGLLAEVARGAHHAHVNGILHRDLKPDNIMVVSEQGRVQPKIIDFGVAVAWLAERHDGFNATRLAERVGTPNYMSPEQREGRLDLDPRSDVYALGVLLLQVLVDPVGEELPSLSSHRYDGLLQGKADSLTDEERDWQARLRSLPEELRWLLRRALASDREQRYDSALSLAQEIERYLAQQPLEAVPASRRYRWSKFLRRNRLPVAMAAVALLALLGGLAAALYGLGEARVERANALAAAERAALEARRAERVADFLRSILGAVDPNVAGDLDKTLLRRVLDQAAERAGTELADDPQVLGSIEAVIGRSYRGLGEPAKALPLLQQARARGALADATSLRVLSMALDDLGKPDEAVTLLQEFRAELLAREGAMAADLLRVDAELAEYGLRGADYRPALAEAERLLPEMEARLGPADTATLLLMNTLARGLARDGRGKEAVNLLLELVERRSRYFGPEHPSTIRDQAGLLIGYLESRRYNEALALANEQLPLSIRIYGESHPATLTVYSLRGSAHKGLQDHASAVADFSQAYAGYSAKFGPQHPHVIGTGYNMASSMALADQPAQAEALLLDLAERAPGAFGAEHPLVFDMRVALIRSRFAQGKPAASEAELLQMQAEAERRFAGHPRQDDVRELLQLYYLAAEQPEEAARWAAPEQAPD